MELYRLINLQDSLLAVMNSNSPALLSGTTFFVSTLSTHSTLPLVVVIKYTMTVSVLQVPSSPGLASVTHQKSAIMNGPRNLMLMSMNGITTTM